MHSRFDAFIRVQPPVAGQLPLTHATDGFTLREVLDTDCLRAQECSVFSGDKLVYCFLGRAAYRANAGEPPNAQLAYAPIYFVLKPTKIPPKRIFPFDTGGFVKFQDAMHQRMRVSDFALDPGNDSARRVIQVYFETNRKYIENEPRTSVQIPPLDFEASSFHSLITDTKRNSYDDRVSAIEIQFDQDIPLAGVAEAVVLPSVLLDDEAIKAKLSAWGAQPLPYDLISRFRPAEYVSQIANIVRDYLAGKGYLD